jgi:hypothetical protein
MAGAARAAVVASWRRCPRNSPAGAIATAAAAHQGLAGDVLSGLATGNGTSAHRAYLSASAVKNCTRLRCWLHRVGATAMRAKGKAPQRAAGQHVLAYNLTRVMNIIGVQPLLAAMRA